MITPDDIIEGRRFTIDGYDNTHSNNRLTVLKVGHDFVAVVYDNGEVDAWYIDTATDCWSFPVTSLDDHWRNHFDSDSLGHSYRTDRSYLYQHPHIGPM
jgi:hypothetical protein